MRVLISAIIILLWWSSSCKQVEKRPSESNIQSVNDSVKFKTVEIPLYEDLKGNPISLNSYKGKKILLNFWATWCRPCVQEMPSLERSKSLLEQENYVLLLASDQSTKEIEVFKAETGFNLNFIRYTGTFSQLKIYALPTTFVFNEKGEKIAEINGASEWDSSEMIFKLKNFK